MIRKNPLIAAACAALLLGAGAPATAQQSDRAKAADAKQVDPRKGANLSRSDRRHIEDMAQANRAEVEAGKLAQSKAMSEDVRKFATHMVEDHGKKLEGVRSLAQAKNVSLPKEPDKNQQNAMKKLQSVSGAEFDRVYMAQMVKDHEATLKLLQDVAGKGDDADLKAAAQKAMPDVEKHLEMARAIAGRVQAPNTQTPVGAPTGKGASK